jgi:hypothetical protein
MDNIYRASNVPPVCINCLIRVRWTDDQTFIINLPAPEANNTTEIQARFTGQSVQISIQPLIFATQPLFFTGTQQ